MIFLIVQGRKSNHFLTECHVPALPGHYSPHLPCANEGPTWLAVMRRFYVRDFRLWPLPTGLLLRLTAAFKISTGRQKRDRERGDDTLLGTSSAAKPYNEHCFLREKCIFRHCMHMVHLLTCRQSICVK